MIDMAMLKNYIPKYLKNIDSLNFSHTSSVMYDKRKCNFKEYCFEIAKAYHDNLISGNLDGIKLLYEIYPKIDTLGKNNYYVKQVVENGLYDIAKWFVDIHGEHIFLYENYIRGNGYCKYNIFEKSLLGNNLKLIKYILFLNNIDYENLGNVLKLRDRIFNDIGINGNLEIIKFIVENIDTNYDSLFSYLACNGHLECMKYLIELGKVDIHLFKHVAINSCFYGHMNVFLWLLELNDDIDINSLNLIFTYLARHGNIDQMKNLLTKYPDIDIGYYSNHIFKLAAKNGHLNIIKWLLEKDNIFYKNIQNGRTFKHAFLNLHYDILEFCLELEPTLINHEYIKYIVISKFYKLKNDYLETFLWLTNKGILDLNCFNKWNFMEICKYSDVNFIKYLIDNSQKYYSKFVNCKLIKEIIYKNINLAKYFMENNKNLINIYNINYGIMMAIEIENINIFKYFLSLLENYYNNSRDIERHVINYYIKSITTNKISISKYLLKKYNKILINYGKYKLDLNYNITLLKLDTLQFIISINVDYFENEYKHDYIISKKYGKIYFRNYLQKVKKID